MPIGITLSLIIAGACFPAFDSAAQSGLSGPVPAHAGTGNRLAANPFSNHYRQDGSRSISLPADANPFDPVWLNNHAIEMAGKGWLGVAEQLLERALKVSPDDPVITSNLRRLRNWHQVRKSEYRPAKGYGAIEIGRGEQYLPEAPAPWSTGR